MEWTRPVIFVTTFHTNAAVSTARDVLSQAEGTSPARRADKRGTTCGFPPLVNHPLSLAHQTAHGALCAPISHRDRKKYEGPKRREFRADGIASYPRIGWCILPKASAAAQKHPEKSLRETGQPAHGYSRAPPPPSPGAKGNRRDVVASQIFPQHVEKIWMRSRAAGHVPWRG